MRKTYLYCLSWHMRWTSRFVLTCLLLTGVFFNSNSQTIWNGGSFTFTETTAGQTDNITASTAFTRVNVLYNPMCQTNPGGPGCSYAGPCNTQWAVGNITNWSTLTYQNFYVANGCFPTNGLPKTYVVHLLAENIYMQVTFLSWQAGGPGMSYTRTTGPACPLTIFPVATPATLCSGQSSNLTVTSTGQIGPVTYTWNPGGLTGSNVTVTPATSTIYTVTGTDGSCTATVTKAVSVSPPIIPTCSGTNNVCFAGSSGTASVTATGGTLNLVPGFTYNFNGSTQGWTTGVVGAMCFGTSGPSTWNNQAFGYTGQSYGTTSVGGEHTFIMSPVIPLPATFSVTAKSFSNNESGYVYPGCTGYDVEYVEYSTDGGTTWIPFFTTSQPDLHGNAMAVWNPLTYTASITPTANGRIRFRYDNADGCCGGTGVNNGWYLDDVVILVPGPYSYLWSNSATTSTISGLSAGTYCVTVTDNVGCSSSCCYTVTTPTSQLLVSCNGTNVNCFGGSNGSASVIATGGTPGLVTMFNYNFNGSTQGWTSGIAGPTCFIGTTAQNTWLNQAFGFTGQSYGTTSVGGEHTYIMSPVIPLPASFTLTAKSFSNNEPGYAYPGCTGYDVEYVEYSTDGGTTWLPFFTTNQANLHGNAMAVWNTLSYTATITPTANGRIRFRYDNADGCCGGSGVNNGWYLDDVQIQVPVTHTYLWSNAATTSSITGITAGNYCVTVTDGIGCSTSCCYNVTQPPVLSATAVGTNASCPFCPDGILTINSVTGGTPPYTYTPSNPRTGLLPGNYCITVTDANGCSTSACATVGAAGCTMVATATLNNNALCFGQSSGSATVTLTGGVTGPWVYLWDNGNTNATANNLNAGNHSVSVTDQGSGCFAQATILITQPSTVIAATCSSAATCGGSSSGTASVTAGSGTPPYTYLWSNGGTTSGITGLSSGPYCVTVTDNNGCTATCCTTVGTLPGIIVSGTTTNVVCSESSTGTINLNVSGGTMLPPPPPLNYDFNGSTQGWTTGTAGLNCNGSSPGASGWGLQAFGFSGQSYGMLGPNAQVENSYIQSPIVSLPSTLSISAKSWSNNEGGYPCFYDVELIEYSTNGGASWSPFFTTQQTGLHDYGNATWMSLAYSTSITPTSNGRIRFRLDSGDGCCGPTTSNPGWYIDDVVISQGTAGTYGFLWSNGATTEDLNGVPAGTYSVTITDAVGCTASYSATITCSDNIPPVFISACNNITTSNSLGSCGANVSWTPPTAVDNCAITYSSNHSPGDFFAIGTTLVTYTAADGCGNSSNCSFNVIVNQTGPPVFTFTETHVNADCQGAASGSIDLSLSGGIPAYSYLWSNGATTQDISNLLVGVYTVTVTDAGGCSGSFVISIGDFPPLAVTETHDNNLCFGDFNGAIDISAVDGKPGYDYIWNDGNTNEDRTGLASGTYTVTVSDNCLSTVVLTINITEPAQLMTPAVVSNVSCYNAGDGTISVIASGGVTPYSYLWSTGATTFSISGLTPGNYTVTLTDANGCTKTASYGISQPNEFFITETHLDVTCFHGGDGAINLSPLGGTPPYAFLWSNGQTTEDITNLTASTYFVTITEASGCTNNLSVTLTSPTQIIATAVVVNQTCALNGNINLTTSGGTPPYAWSWSNGATTEDIGNLTPNTYTVMITDGNGCQRSYTFTITLNNTLIATIVINHNATCLMNDGVATVTPSGGIGPYSYLWNTVPAQTTATATGLPPGTSKVIVTDAGGAGCISNIFVVVPNTNGMGVSLSSPTYIGGKNISCNGGSNGSATATPLYSTGPYSYIWNTGATTATISGLSAGIYTVTVSNIGCVATGQVTLTQPVALTATTTKTNASCTGGADGTATAHQAGGTPAFSYSWNTVPVQNTKTATGLATGVYVVTVTDANGCTATASAAITAGSSVIVTGVVTNLNCNNINTGAITQTISGGTGPYTYLWNNGNTSKNRTGLAAGSYTVTVTDSKGCTTSASYTVTQPPLLVITVVKTNVSCNGGNNGTATATASGGTAPYTYSWNTVPVQTNATATGLTSGSKTVVVTDFKGCTKSLTITISQPPAITISTSQVNVSTPGGNNGSATATAAGGTSPYSYSWNTVPVKTTQTITGLTAGSYTVTVTDANGCTKTKSVTITQPGPRMVGADDGEITEVNIYPNPSNGVFRLSFEANDNYQYVVTLLDLTGRIVHRKSFETSTGQNIQSFDFSTLPKGVYMMNLDFNSQHRIIRVILE